MSKGNFAVDGSIDLATPVDPHRATPWTLFVKGTWGGGSIAVTVSPDGADPHALATPIAISADGYKVLPLMGGVFTLTLTGSTAPNLNWWLL